MNDEGALHRRPRPDQVSRPTEITTVRRRSSLNELDDLVDVRERLVCAIDELDAGEDGIDACRQLLEGLLEDFDLAVTASRKGAA